MSLLEVRGLGRTFGAVAAVDDLTLDLRGGTIMGFVGPNGAGKTTTMRILATLDAPTAGDVLLDGRSIVEAPDEARPHIGYMPERSGVYEDMTVTEYLDFFARAYGLTAAARQRRVADIVEFTGLGSFGAKLLTTLSKGMKQRASLGRALVNDPTLLILDEPADGLDPRARIELREMLRALAKGGKAILISSHILTELGEICDECAIIEQGKLLAVGPVDAIAQRNLGAPSAEIDLQIAQADAHVIGQASSLLLSRSDVAQVTRLPGGLRVRLARAEPAPPLETTAASLLAALVGAGLPVCSFHLHRADLEDAFMSVTRGQVS